MNVIIGQCSLLCGIVLCIFGKLFDPEAKSFIYEACLLCISVSVVALLFHVLGV